MPLVDTIRAKLGCNPREVSSDAGFANEANLSEFMLRRITAYLAPGCARDGEENATGAAEADEDTFTDAMAAQFKRAGRRSRYRLQHQVVEPMFGQSKQTRASGDSCYAGSIKANANGP